jgi:putative ABC transport system ATP-binding protein
VALADNPAQEPALVARDLFRFYHAGDDETFALRGVSLEVRNGEMLAVVGPSGSGKSTLLRCLAGLDEPDGGYVAIAGRRITRRPESERSAIRGKLVGVLQQSGNLLEHLSVRANIALAQSLVGQRQQTSPDDLLGEVGLGQRGDAVPSRLSGGEAARAGLAVAIANDPPLLLADEPTAEVDEANERVLMDLLRRRASRGGGVLIVTHSTWAAAAADRTVHMADGRLGDA